VQREGYPSLECRSALAARNKLTSAMSPPLLAALAMRLFAVSLI
jgi:hypothetical protein